MSTGDRPPRARFHRGEVSSNSAKRFFTILRPNPPIYGPRSAHEGGSKRPWRYKVNINFGRPPRSTHHASSLEAGLLRTIWEWSATSRITLIVPHMSFFTLPRDCLRVGWKHGLEPLRWPRRPRCKYFIKPSREPSPHTTRATDYDGPGVLRRLFF